MSDTPQQFALREWQRQFRLPATWITLAGLAAILALIGPFGTEGVLNLPTAFLYWMAVATVGYAIGLGVNSYADHRLSDDPGPMQVVLRGVVIGLGVAGFVMAVNKITFGSVPSGLSLVVLTATVIVIAIIVTALLHVLHTAASPAPHMPSTASQVPPIMERVPLDKRGALLALSVEDHYVRVLTSQGETLILMRLGDAIREVGGSLGAQVHRSHWVAFSAVTSARRDGTRAILTLSNDAEIPVSRANLSKIKEAGLLPR